MSKIINIHTLLENYSENNNNHKLINLIWLLAILVGILYVWVGRHAMNPDGVSYLDIGDAYFRGDWSMAINAYWSPLYSWLLGLSMFLLKPSSYHEFDVVHIVNYFLFLFALASFHYYLTKLLDFHRNHSLEISKKGEVLLPEWVLLILGYTLFLWSSLSMISIEVVIPDLCLSAFVYLISGILLRIRIGQAGLIYFIALGICLGLGYLSKTPMFILSFVFLACSVFRSKDFKRSAPRIIIALAFFFLIVSPFIIAISKTKNRFTFGDSGKINYFWFVNNNMILPHYLGNGSLKNPVRVLFSSPLIYEFEMPAQATYPILYDPSYWNEGIKLNFNLKSQLLTLFNNVSKIFSKFENCIILFTFIILFSMNKRKKELLKDIWKYWFLIIPALSALAMYSLIVIEPRYIAPFVVVLATGVFSAFHLHNHKETKEWMIHAVLCMILLIYIPIGYQTMRHTFTLFKYFTQEKNMQDYLQWYIANSMEEIGLRKGDKILYAGYPYGAYWARLARIQIVAETKESDSFCDANSLTNSVVIESLAKINIKAIVARIKSDECFFPHIWKRIENTDIYVHLL